MKYKANITQPQFAGKVRISPAGGELTDAELKAIQNDAYGVQLIETGVLILVDDKAPVKAGKK
jgi:hypothetical protein